MRCDEIGVKVTHREFEDFLNGVQPGQFFHIRGYKSQNDKGKISDNPEDASEIADYWARWGIKYENFKARDVRLLNELLVGCRRTFTIVHGSWIPNEFLQGQTPSVLLDSHDVLAMDQEDVKHLVTATVRYDVHVGDATIRVAKTGPVNLLDVTRFTNHEAKNRTPCTLSYRVDSDHPLVVAAIGGEDLQETLLQGLLHPAPSKVDYEKQARSCFSMDRADGRRMTYIRDVAVVRKLVRRPGVHEFKAALPINAVKAAINEQVLVRGKYRQFILNDGNYEAITIEGQSIICDGLDDDGFYFALPRHVAVACEEVART